MTYHEPVLMTAEQWAQRLADLRWLSNAIRDRLEPPPPTLMKQAGN